MNRRQALGLFTAASLALLLGGQTPLAAAAGPADQGPPFRTTSDTSTSELMLMGHDPVAYFTQNEAVAGNPAIQADHMGVTWRFASEANKAAFLSEPNKYMPQFGGFCSNGIHSISPVTGDS